MEEKTGNWVDSVKKKQLLIVEDNPVNLALLKRILQPDYEVLTAENGQVALDLLSGPAGDTISAMVLDIIMPVMDGYEVLRRMRADPRLMQIPVLVASAQDGSDDNKEILALSLGAHDYVAKPYKPEIIRHRLANTIYLRETAAFANTVRRDALTGMYSKEYFYLQVSALIKSHPRQTYDMVCSDIEHFKLVNDLYGVAVGDQLLKHCASVMKTLFSSHGICGRIGPDVFAFFYPHAAQYDDTYFSPVSEQVNAFHIQLNITLRHGIYVADDPTVPPNIMCDRAQLAIAAIKGLYGTYYKFYDNGIRQQLMEEQFITSHMQQALSDGEFQVYFQPKYELKTEKVMGAEALVRWNSPTMGFLSPGRFIPLFEKNGFITDLDHYVWEICCQKIRAWIDRGNRPIPVSVNVSRTDLFNPAIESIWVSLVTKYRISPKYIYLEITESAYTQNSQQLIDAITRLKKRGFCIEMDDFGSGYSSLNMLSELPIDILKLDMGFMQTEKKHNSRSILSFIISLAKWMNLGIIAEGVETAEQADLLRSLNCECAQGYYYARPMPAEEFEALIGQQCNLYPIMKLDPAERRIQQQAPIYHPNAIFIVDPRLTDSDALTPVFSSRYTVLTLPCADDAVARIEEEGMQAAAALCALTPAAPFASHERFIALCLAKNIPVITIHDDARDMLTAINAGVSDCILRPYVPAVIKRRVENAMCKAEMSQFEREREINAAILEMKKRAEHDALTGLLNRTEFQNRITETTRGNTTAEGIFIILDIDNFKSVNDTYGHVTGDRVLLSLARLLRDTFTETDMISRMGGDEFALFVPYLLLHEELLQKIRQLCAPRAVCDGTVQASCSAGVCLAPQCGQDYQELYEHADIALLHAKRRGKSQFLFFEEGMEAAFDETLEKRASALLDDASDAMFVSDAVTSEILYINDTACRIVGKSKASCIGMRCYALFWEREKNCDRCAQIDACRGHYYEETALMTDQTTRVHIKAKLDDWDGRKVKIHYLQIC